MHLIHELFGTSLVASLFIIANLILVEGLLSIDNAAVLATMVGKLKGEEQKNALHYGIWGALIMRFSCMLLASWLTGLWVLKLIGGLYLVYLCYAHFTTAESPEEEIDPDKSKIILFAEKYLKLNQFWATVILVEIMDMAFSVDNIFAAVAFTKYIGLIWIGVGVGIFVMRYVAQIFVKLMERFGFLANVAYIVIGILGVKLALVLVEHYWPTSTLGKLMKGEHVDLFFSLLTLAVFLLPIAWYWAKNKWFITDGPDDGEFVSPIKLSDGTTATVSTINKTTVPVQADELKQSA